MTRNELAAAITGRPNALMIPAWAKEHEIRYMLANKNSINIDKVEFSEASLFILGYFVRDLRELTSSAFYKEGAGTINIAESIENATVMTSVTTEEIRSFVTVFRRLYMEKEPANLSKAAEVVAAAIDDHPLSTWIRESVVSYDVELDSVPDMMFMIDKTNWTFSRKRLIDVFLYTRFAHQPDARRARQFKECLQAAKNNEAILTWYFLTEVWKCAISIRNLGIWIEHIYDAYCKSHKVEANIIASISSQIPGIGSMEKKSDERKRILKEKAATVGKANWERAGSPPNELDTFVSAAFNDLVTAFSVERST